LRWRVAERRGGEIICIDTKRKLLPAEYYYRRERRSHTVVAIRERERQRKIPKKAAL